MSDISYENSAGACVTEIYVPAHPGLRPLQDFTFIAVTIILASLLLAYFCPDALASSGDGLEKVIYEDGFDGYIIGPGDCFKLNVYENGEFSDEYRVGPDGKVSVPMAGTFTAAGRTREGLTAEISGRLGRFISSPMVTVLMTEYNNNYVDVFGDTSHPGRYAFPGEIGMLSLVSRVGDAIFEEGTRCDVVRGDGTLASFDISDRAADLQKSEFSRAKLKSGDSVYFTSKRNKDAFVYVMGDVKNPGMFKYADGENVPAFVKRTAGCDDLSGRPLRIIRLLSARCEQFDYDPAKPADRNPRVMPGDVIYVSVKGEKQLRFRVSRISPGVLVAVVGAAAYKRSRD